MTRRGGAPTAAGRPARTAGRAQRGRGPQAHSRPAAVGRAARPRAAPTNGPATVPVRDRRLTHLRANGERARWRSRGPAARRSSSIASAPCTSCRRIRSGDRRRTAPALLRHLLGSRSGAHRRSGWGMDRGPVWRRSGHKSEKDMIGSFAPMSDAQGRCLPYPGADIRSFGSAGRDGRRADQTASADNSSVDACRSTAGTWRRSRRGRARPPC